VQWADADRDGRIVVAQLWYPATAGGERAQYLGRDEDEARAVAEAMAENLGVPGFFFDAIPRARSHAAPDAPPVDGAAFPIVLFSPGSGGVRGQNTAWAEELASRGYLVAGLDHLDDSPVVVLDDGTRVRSRMPEAYAAAWASEDPAAEDRVTDEFIRVRADDLRFALDRLAPLGNGQAVVAGHSFGGATAFTVLAEDPRFAAAIDLDGGLGGALPGPYRQPVLAVTSPAYYDRVDNPDYAPRLEQALDSSASTSYRLTIPGTNHFSFTDFALLAPPVVPDANAVAADASADFLAHVLRGAPLDLARYGDLAVHPG
jgi:dienelactone hydrolase